MTMDSETRPRCRYILGSRVDIVSYEMCTEKILKWTETGESRYVCFSTVHMIMEAYASSAFRMILNEADLVTPDGMPLVWMQTILGARGANRVTGHEITLMLCEEAARRGMPVGFYGAGPTTIENLVANMKARFPGLNVVYAVSPPFRPHTPEEDEKHTDEIKASGCQLLFLGLGCPKQERWMQSHRGRVPAVTLAVGAVFDTYAGSVRRAPRLLQNLGLEWLFRLISEPRRLWKRYLTTNSKFLILATLQALRVSDFRNGSGRP
jgi:N-acetylglucosaminyldiphosphoundecaprenol N-acetyl-beta-D-mannosaminyltransferase